METIETCRRPGSPPGWCPGAAAFVLGFVLALPLGAQGFEGRAFDSEMPIGIPDAQITLLSADSVEITSVLTDEEGRFVLPVPEPGFYRIRSRHFAYLDLVSQPLEISDTIGFVGADIYLTPNPTQLEGIGVEVSAVRAFRHLVDNGFYRRERRSQGYFIGSEEIQLRRPRSVRALLRGIPGIIVSYDGRIRVTGRGATGSCIPQVWIDRTPIEPDFPLSVAIDVEEISAVEVYRGLGQTLPEFVGRSQAGCGAVVFWTWR